MRCIRCDAVPRRALFSDLSCCSLCVAWPACRKRGEQSLPTSHENLSPEQAAMRAWYPRHAMRTQSVVTTCCRRRRTPKANPLPEDLQVSQSAPFGEDSHALAADLRLAERALRCCWSLGRRVLVRRGRPWPIRWRCSFDLARRGSAARAMCYRRVAAGASGHLCLLHPRMR
jgi:hypothetical protein